ncbi:MAG TPA: hypothetical protein VFW99_03030 [Candidatus Nitrosotalea sp.]|nr:hypothetical protein [Candidatus Nitrosotalea sp.]
MTLLVSTNAYAACITVNGTQQCAGPPEIHMTIGLDSNRYATNDTITVSGHVDQILLNQNHNKIQIEVYNPNNILYRSDQVIVDKNGTYSYPFKINGLLGISGWYNVKVTPISTENIGVGFTYKSSPYSLTVGNKTFSFVYKIDYGKINAITVNPHEKSLTLFVNQVRSLTLKLPRELIDSKDDKNNDIPFLVFTNYTKTEFEDTISSDTRTLSIDIPPMQEGNNILLRENAAIKIIGTILTPQVNLDSIPYTVPSPFLQLREGIPIKDIECLDGFELIVKSDGKTPACVRHDTVGTLILRGWASVNGLSSNLVCNNQDCRNMVEKAGYVCNAEGSIFSCYVQNSADVAKVTIPNGASNSQSSTSNYVPSKIIVVLGKNSTVQWYNQDNVPSSVTSDLKKFDSTFIMPNHSWTFVFDRPGIYWYHSESHPWMHAEVIVLPGESVPVIPEGPIHP